MPVKKVASKTSDGASLKVKDLATREVSWCSPGTDLAAAAMIMWGRDCGFVPIVGEDGRPVGVVTDRDICMAVCTRHWIAAHIAVSDVMSGLIHSCHLEDHLQDALKIMGKAQVRRLLVLDETGHLAGVLSITDVLRVAREGRGGKASPLTFAEVISTYKAICGRAEIKKPSPVKAKRPSKKLSENPPIE